MNEPAETPVQQYLSLAQSDPEKLLALAIQKWQAADGYRLKLRSQERLAGRLTSQSIIEATVMASPYAVSLRWQCNAGAIDRLLWMPSEYGKELLVHPTGIAGKLVDHVRVDPNSERVRNSSRRDVTDFGLVQTLQNVLNGYRAARQKSTVCCQSLGIVNYEELGQPAIALKMTSSDRSSDIRTMYVLLAQDLRPLRVQQLDWNDQLLGCYDFTEYRPIQLSAADFSLETVFN